MAKKRYVKRSRAKKVLVVGDWAVDINKITMIHRVPTATRFGLEHDLVLHPEKTKPVLGAAGRVMFLLENATYNDKKIFDLKGIGIWDQEDTGEISKMIRRLQGCGRTQHRLNNTTSVTGNAGALFNLCDAIPEKELVGTTIITRRYRREGDDIHLLTRDDSDLQPQGNQAKWITNEKMLESSQLVDFLDREGKDIEAVVIKDISKGVISLPLIRFLVARYGDKPWFVSTKDWLPNWFSALHDVSIKLLLITQVAAQRALRNRDLKQWLTKSGYPTKDALVQMDKITRPFNKSDQMIVIVLPKDQAIIARDWNRGREKGERIGCAQQKSSTIRINVETAMASVFLPAAVAHLLADPSIMLETLLKRTFSFTQQWMVSENLMIVDHGRWSSDSVPKLEIGSASDSTVNTAWEVFKWEEAKNKWDEALSHCGIIMRGRKKCIELWRSMIEVDDYACCVKSNRETLRVLEPISKLIFDKMLYERGLTICPYSIRHIIRMCLLGNYLIASGRESIRCCPGRSRDFVGAVRNAKMSGAAHRLIAGK